MRFLDIGSTLKGKNLLLEEQIFPLRVDPCRKGRTKGRTANPVGTLIHLNTTPHPLPVFSIQLTSLILLNAHTNDMGRRCVFDDHSWISLLS